MAKTFIKAYTSIKTAVFRTTMRVALWSQSMSAMHATANRDSPLSPFITTQGFIYIYIHICADVYSYVLIVYAVIRVISPLIRLVFTIGIATTRVLVIMMMTILSITVIAMISLVTITILVVTTFISITIRLYIHIYIIWQGL